MSHNIEEKELNVRVATAHGKWAIWMFIFGDRESKKNMPKIIKICFYIENLSPTRGNFKN